MRIVHEIEDKPTCSVCCEPYARAARQTKSRGFKVDLMVYVKEDGIVPGEMIHVEGNAKYVLHMLKELVRQVETVGDMYVEEGRVIKDWDKL